MRQIFYIPRTILLILLLSLKWGDAIAETSILNVSYDPTREFYQAYNKEFSKHWKEKTGETVKVDQSHGGSGKQARAVIGGLKADVVTLALSQDIDQIVKHSQLIDSQWQDRLPHRSAPYTSIIVFLVRKDNPKGIKDWNDLTQLGIEIVTPNPKTSGGARWNYLAAWGYALKQPGANEKTAFEFVKQVFKNVKVLDSGARASLTTFQKGIGDVLITWENEALLAKKQLESDDFQLVYPSVSILAEPTVSIVDKVVDRKNTRKVATEYVEYLYSPIAQDLAAQYFYRPQDKNILEKYKTQFPSIDIFTIDQVFGGWSKAQASHFAEGSFFDSIYQ